jgi:hypothetical protein
MSCHVRLWLVPGRTGCGQSGGVDRGAVTARAVACQPVAALRVAALSDFHANVPALEAVLAEVERVSVDLIVIGVDSHAAGPPLQGDLSLTWRRGPRNRRRVGGRGGAPAGRDLSRPQGRRRDRAARLGSMRSDLVQAGRRRPHPNQTRRREDRRRGRLDEGGVAKRSPPRQGGAAAG